MKSKILGTVAGVALLTSTNAVAAPKEPSDYLKCDGNPNNMSAGELLARFIGAVTLLSIFAPSPEFPDPDARLFGEDGVAACTRLISDPQKGEGLPVRRIPLILARALHYIEMKDYTAAIADVDLARAEATAAGFTDDPYFQRSLARSFRLIESAAKIRMGDVDGARSAALADLERFRYSYYPLRLAYTYTELSPALTEIEEQRMEWLSLITIEDRFNQAIRYEDAGRFGKAARSRDLTIAFFDALSSEDKISWIYACAAISHALAGNWEIAEKHAQFARQNVEKLQKAGRGEKSAGDAIEQLDLYEIIKLTRDGDVKNARLRFAARSQWTAPSSGQVMEVTRRLWAGAKDSEKFGALEKSPDQILQERIAQVHASRLESDKQNRTLFTYILPYAKVEDFEDLTKNVWNTDNSRLMISEPDEKTGEWELSVNGGPMTQPTALLLHSALMAKAKGFDAFQFTMLSDAPSRASARFGNFGDGSAIEPLYLDADAVIAELREIIPDPEERKRRRAARK